MASGPAEVCRGLPVADGAGVQARRRVGATNDACREMWSCTWPQVAQTVRWEIASPHTVWV